MMRPGLSSVNFFPNRRVTVTDKRENIVVRQRWLITLAVQRLRQWANAPFYALNQLHTVVQPAFQLGFNPGPLFAWWTWREEMTASIESSLTGREYNYTASCWWTHTNSLMGPSGSTDLRHPSTLSFVSVLTEMSSSDICSNRIKSSPWTWDRQLSAPLWTLRQWQVFALIWNENNQYIKWSWVKLVFIGTCIKQTLTSKYVIKSYLLKRHETLS